jgi:hypothetical protein
VGCCRVGPGISSRAAHRAGPEPLVSSSSCHRRAGALGCPANTTVAQRVEAFCVDRGNGTKKEAASTPGETYPKWVMRVAISRSTIVLFLTLSVLPKLWSETLTVHSDSEESRSATNSLNYQATIAGDKLTDARIRKTNTVKYTIELNSENITNRNRSIRDGDCPLKNSYDGFCVFEPAPVLLRIRCEDDPAADRALADAAADGMSERPRAGDHAKIEGQPRAAQIACSPRCGAHSRRTGQPCRQANVERSLPDTRRTIDGAPKGNRNAFKHDLYTARAIASRGEIAALIRAMRDLACSTEDVS